MMIRLNIWMPLVFGLTAVWMGGLSQAAPQRGGGKVTPPSLPADMRVRYRVEFVPLPSDASNTVVHDVNDVREAVGAYNDVDGFRVGYHYDADTNIVKTANEMIPGLPEQWVNTSFVGINNHGAIVGMVQDISRFDQCILIYPSTAQSGYSFEITSPYGLDSHFTKINDSGDIVGISWDGAGVGSAFAYNPALVATALPFTFFGSQGAWFDAIKVTNTRLGVVRVGQEVSWFDFLDGPETRTQLPLGSESFGLSKDGQITVSEGFVQQKGKTLTYFYTPGIMVSGEYVWRGNPDDGRAELVNSKVGSNLVGDVVGFNGNSGVRWLRHADRPDWGYLDLGEMVVFSSSADAERWKLTGPSVRVWGMSERDPTTGFGVLIGNSIGTITKKYAYVLIPEIVP